ncbi:MAG: hypothetical protein JWL65_2699 [Gammaproteobacteria bacterium]|nr:hypothetical protein [Gammaproteobacteria bacterium]
MSHLGLHSATMIEGNDWIAHAATDLVEADACEPFAPLIIEGGIGWTERQDRRLQSATAHEYVREIERLRRDVIAATRTNSVLTQESARFRSVLTDIARQPAGDSTAQALAGEVVGASLVSRVAPSHSELTRELQLAIEELRDLGLIMEAESHEQILHREAVGSTDGCSVDGNDAPAPT